MDGTKEYVLCAAVQYRGRIYTTSRHHPNIRFALRQRLKKFNAAYAHDGFETSSGRFVNRKEAADIAYAAGQTFGRKLDFLYSEDIQ